MRFRIWTDRFVHVEKHRYKGQSFVVEAPSIEEAVAKVLPMVPEGAKVMSWTQLDGDVTT